MNTKKIFPLVLLLGMLAPFASAQTQPVLTVAITEIDVNGAPQFGFNANPGNPSATPPTNPNPPTTGATSVNPNGGSAAYGQVVSIWALATGTAPVGGFTYSFYVNGKFIGVATPSPNYNQNYGIAWTPPEPGVYYFSCTATDGISGTVNSLPIEFFATGIQIVGPPPNSIVPVGSSVVVQAAAALAGGAIASVSFFDESGLLGSTRTYPYSIIYTPPAVNPVNSTNVNTIYAESFDANGALHGTSATQTVVMATAVGPIPIISISSPPNIPVSAGGPATVPIPNYVASSSASIPVTVNASSPQGIIQQVQLYIDGVLFQTIAAPPYTFSWQPSVTGQYNLTALAYDDKNNVIASTTSTSPTKTPAPTTVIVGSLPTIAITSPTTGGTISGGGANNGTATVTATATDTNVNSLGVPVGIQSVQFFQDGNLVYTATSPTTSGGNVYSATFVPKQNLDPTTNKPIASILTAVATDNLGFSTTSSSVSVTVNLGGNSTTTVVGTPPTVSITQPASQGNVVVNTPYTLVANAAATNSPGNITSVQFLVDNIPLATVSAYPYTATWTPTALGTYKISASATDNDGNVTNSAQVNVTVVLQPPPSISITGPTSGSIVTVGTSLTVTASASSPDGTIKQVQFFSGGSLIGTSTTPPYSVAYTPTSTGVYDFTAVATDNSNATTTSGTTVVEVTPATGGLGTVEYFGNYGNGGSFAYAIVDGSVGTFIGYTNGSPTALYYPDLTVSSGGGFSANAVNKVVPLSGNASVTGVQGTLNPGNTIFIGALTQVGSVAVASGFYSGNLVGQATSQLTAIVGAGSQIMVYIGQGTYSDAGAGSIDSSGHFTITTGAGNTVTGTLNSSTGFMTGTLAGGPGGSFTAAIVSGGTFSDGVLSNLSTRAPVGTGASIMIAGFTVAPSASKQLLVRADGPALTALGITGAVAATQLNIYGAGSSTVPIATNIGWSANASNAAAVAAADAQVGAFPLTTGSSDSALTSTFAPGPYTVQVSGVGTDTGVGLVEVYDMDTATPFTAKKLTNVSTRANVGTGQSVAIAGFNITGSAPKRLLIRGAGPGLVAMGVTGALSAPHLQLMNKSGVLIRENYSWQLGNGTALVDAAELATGAFTYASGSADSAILIVLPPGSYSAVLSGAGAATGVAIVEVYEVP
jgi:hypothetical protein